MLQRYRELQDIIAILGIDTEFNKNHYKCKKKFNFSYHKTSHVGKI